MLYSLLTLSDETEIVYSQIYKRNGIDVRKVYVERPVDLDMGFYHATFWMTADKSGEWSDVVGFDSAEIHGFEEMIKAHLDFERRD